ncbi:MAG: hypothetical protein [Bacteriophage sp.]|nr:MAG: hypothetical protein [Bacteriophage sp.]
MDYRPGPSAGGFPLQFIQLNLETTYFGKLNSDPITLIEAVPGYYICPAFYFLQSTFSADTGQNAYIGNKKDLDLYGPGAYQGVLNITNLSGTDALLYQPCQIPNPVSFQASENTRANESLVLWQQADDNTWSITAFKIQIGYYLIPTY